MKHISYAVDLRNGLVHSRVNDEIAYPVLVFLSLPKDGSFNKPFDYHLDKCNVHHFVGEWRYLKWTKRIPIEIKNQHRIFWGFKQLKVNSLHKMIESIP